MYAIRSYYDVDSKAARYKRLSEMWLSLAACFIPLFAVLISTGAINITAFVKPKLLYYTPGLWEMSGTHFWRAFLFETPFAFLRGFSWVILPIFLLVYMTFLITSYSKHYTKLYDIPARDPGDDSLHHGRSIV